ncbi:helix-turn-helix domain-containing protein [Pedobacter duraquae]|uniref:Helix-turn-helix protein n=1 Tax=Pedobacter duraquae TaxID=425511 RepID=A0A4R6IDG2_9SPHI|nr:helix-turn-helix transcriptional regulator [Pedobacter duraquae]TDO20303.1 helix-turn-helix protein [Pedobacter duraquae]
MQSQIFLKARERANPENRIFVSKNLALIEQLHHVMDELGWSQKRLSQELGKSESEISKWLTGLHNFTFKSISKLEAVLGRELLVTPKSYQHRYTANVELHVRKIGTQVHSQFMANSNLYACETNVKVNCDGKTVVVRNDKSYRFETASAWGSSIETDQHQPGNERTNAA